MTRNPCFNEDWEFRPDEEGDDIGLLWNSFLYKDMINELLTPEHPLKDEPPNMEPISLLWCQQGQSKERVFWKLSILNIW